MSPGDSRHGTWAGYQRGCRGDCCTTAARNYQKRRKYDADRGIARTVPLVGTERRIQALIALGWTAEHIGAELGHSRAWVQQVLNGRPGASRPHADRRIMRTTAEKVEGVYERLSMTFPPERTRMERLVATRSRNRARANGWPPPLAWDDIDNPDAEPYAPGDHQDGAGRPEVTATKLADFDWLVANGESVEMAAERVGLLLSSVRDMRQRLRRREEVA